MSGASPETTAVLEGQYLWPLRRDAKHRWLRSEGGCGCEHLRIGLEIGGFRLSVLRQM